MRVVAAILFFFTLMTGAFAQTEPLRPGDKVQISVWQDPKLDRTVVVGPDGMIAFPLAGHVNTSGMTPQALENVLKERLQKNYSGQLDITVSLNDINKDSEALTTPRFFVTGEVQKPGPYLLRNGTTIVQGIALAGGLSIYAAGQRIQVHRQERGIDSIFTFDFNAFKAGTIATDNITLRSGDVIIVPERGLLE